MSNSRDQHVPSIVILSGDDRAPVKIGMACGECGATGDTTRGRDQMRWPCEVCGGGGWIGIDAREPMTVPIGAAARVAVMQVRRSQGVSIWHAEDETATPDYAVARVGGCRRIYDRSRGFGKLTEGDDS